MNANDLINALVKTNAPAVLLSSQGYFYTRIKESGSSMKVKRLRLQTTAGVSRLVEYDPKELKIAERRVLSKNAWREGLKIHEIAMLFNISTATATTDVNHNP